MATGYRMGSNTGSGFLDMNLGSDPSSFASGTGGQNQFMTNMPSLPQIAPGMTPVFSSSSSGSGQSQTPPGVVPPATNANLTPSGSSVSPFSTDIGGGLRAVSPIDPNLTGSLFNYLASQIGQGATPFNLSALLPSGGTTGAGQLSAPLNQIMQILQQFYSTGQGGLPGQQTLEQFSKGIDVLPAFKNITDAMQRQIAEGRANLQEQFNVGGGLVGSPYGTAATDYETQSAKDKSSILSQLFLSSLPLQESAASTLAQGGTNFASLLQGMDQASIDRLLQEFIRTRPEYSPLLGAEFSAATTFPDVRKQEVGQSPLGGALGGLANSAPGILQALGDAGLL